MSKSTKKALFALLALVILIGAMLAVHAVFMPEAQAGLKSINVEIVHADGSTKSYLIQTDAENLRSALEKEELISGEEGPYGLFVQTVDGESVDESSEEWWCFTKSGETLMTGVEDTMIADGDCYEITFTVGW